MADCQSDIDILLECVRCQLDDPAALRQSLKTLSSLLTTDYAKDYFRKCGGVKYVYKFLFTQQSADVQVSVFFCLGSAVEKHVYSQNCLTNHGVFCKIHRVLQSPETPSQLMLSAVYFLMCLVANNSEGQRLTQETSCLSDLMTIFRAWMEKVATNVSAAAPFSLVTTTLSMCVNNPQNEENQRLCSMLLPHIFKTVANTISCRFLGPILSLVGLMVANNVFNQDRVRKCGGLGVLISKLCSLATCSDHDEDLTAAVQVAATLDSCITDNGCNIKVFCDTCGTDPLFLLLESDRLGQQEQLQIVLLVSHVLQDDSGSRCSMLQAHHDKLVSLLTRAEEEELVKAVKYVLHMCQGSEDFKCGAQIAKHDREIQNEKQSSDLILRKIEELATKLDHYQEDPKYDVVNRTTPSIQKSSNFQNMMDEFNSQAMNTHQWNRSINEQRRPEFGVLDALNRNNSSSEVTLQIPNMCSQSEHNIVNNKEHPVDRDRDWCPDSVIEKLDLIQQTLASARFPLHVNTNDCVKVIDYNHEPRYCSSSKICGERASQSTHFEVGCPNTSLCSMPTGNKSTEREIQGTLLGDSFSQKSGRTGHGVTPGHDINNSAEIQTSPSACVLNESVPSTPSHIMLENKLSSKEDQLERDIYSQNGKVLSNPCCSKVCPPIYVAAASNVPDDDAFRKPSDVHVRRNIKQLCHRGSSSAGIRCNVRHLARRPVVGVQSPRVIDGKHFLGSASPAAVYRRVKPGIRTPVNQSTGMLRIHHTNVTPISNMSVLGNAVPCPSPVHSEYDLHLLRAAKQQVPRELCTPVVRKFVSTNINRCWTDVRRVCQAPTYSKPISMHSWSKWSDPYSDSDSDSDLTCSPSEDSTNGEQSIVSRQLEGCYPPVVLKHTLNSRTYNIAVETSTGTCFYHKDIREAERKFILKQKLNEKRPRKSRPLPALNNRDQCNSCPPNNTLSVYDFSASSGASELSKREVSPPVIYDDNPEPFRISRQKRSRLKYSQEELEHLKEGVKQFGTKWSQILATFMFHASRTAVDLKEKYKRMMTEKCKSTRKHRGSSFSMCEERRLRRGVKALGYNWKGILMMYRFSKDRTAEELRNRWRALMKSAEQ